LTTTIFYTTIEHTEPILHKDAFMLLNTPVEKNADEEKISFLKTIVENLSFPRPYGTQSNKKAEAYVCKEFKNIFNEFNLIGKHNNIYAGCSPDKAEILIGAHYDSVPNSPAADDNASAVAVMLLCAKELKNNSNICFMAFNCEEYGIAGSKEVAKNLNNLKEVHILEMVGYTSAIQENPLPGLIDCPTKGDFIGCVSNSKTFMTKIMSEANKISIPVVGVSLPTPDMNVIESISPHLLRSDHVGFWKNHIPTAMWTDTAEFRNKNYHLETDTPDTLDYFFMSEVAKNIIGLYK
jgi:hypothetical protein